MTIERTEVLWIESRSDYSTSDVAALSGLPLALIEELIACGALQADATQHFAAEAVGLAQAAQRLQEHFELDANGVAVAVTLLRRVRRLEAGMAVLKAQGFERFD